MRAGQEALAETFAAKQPGRPRKDAVYGEAAAHIRVLAAQVEQTAAEAAALRKENTTLKLALAYTRKLLQIFSGGEKADRSLRFTGEQKLAVCQLAAEAKTQGLSLQAFARATGKCYTTILQWFRLYDPEQADAVNVQALTDKPSTAAHIHNKLENWVVAVIRRVALRHPDWGGRQIALHLRRLAWTKLHVAPSTVYEYLAQWRGPKKGGPTGGNNRYRFLRPGAAWCLDFCELRAGGLKASLLLVLDDCTRQILAWRLVSARSTAGVLATLKQTMADVGKPLLVKADNGPEFRSAFRAGLLSLGVAALNSPYYYAPFNGKVERTFRGLRRFLRCRPQALSMAALEHQIARWVYEHNTLCVSESLGLRTPHEAMQHPNPTLGVCAGEEVIAPEIRDSELILRFTNRKGHKARLALPYKAA